MTQKNWLHDICVNDYVLGPVAVTVTPTSTRVVEACGTTLTATASGSPPFYYQWMLNGSPVAGATASTCTMPPSPVAGSPYTCTVAVNNLLSSATSGNAVVNVTEGYGMITVVQSPIGVVTINWAPCCRIQVATELMSNPAETVWIDVDETPPLTVPVPVDLGTGPLPTLFLRAISP